MSLRRILLAVVKASGGFRLARALTPAGLRILCYHGISSGDEHLFQPKLFMRQETFRRRMEYLRDRDYPVLGLDAALAMLTENRLPAGAVVITFDDGWEGTGGQAAPLLQALHFPSTLYVTTHDAVERVPVFDVALRYLLWRGRRQSVDLSQFGLDATGVALTTTTSRERIASLLGDVAARRDATGQNALLQQLADRLGVSWCSAGSVTLFRLMNPSQLSELPGKGMDLQLHTHHHRLPPDDRGGVEAEIVENRVALKNSTVRPLVHLCYPSGEYHARQFPWLRALGIVSATTCLSGFNYRHTERLELRRFLDGENISQVEFEAELSGFLELMRKVRAKLRGRLSVA